VFGEEREQIGKGFTVFRSWPLGCRCVIEGKKRVSICQR